MQENQNCLTPYLQPNTLCMGEQTTEEDCVLTFTCPSTGEQEKVKSEKSSELIRSYELCGKEYRISRLICLTSWMWERLYLIKEKGKK